MSRNNKPYHLEDPNPEKTKKLGVVSAVLAVALPVIWAIWDVVPAIWEGRNDTISEQIRNFSRFAWVAPWFWGALTAHFFINVGQPGNYRIRFYAFAAATVALVTANCLTYFALDWEAPAWVRGSAVFVGMIFGLVLWSQDV